jgi:adenylate cyclase
VNSWIDDPETNRLKGLDLSHRALQASSEDPNVLSRTGWTLAYFGEDIDGALALLDRSLKLNPNSVESWRWSAWLRLWAGQPDSAIKHFENSLRLDPVGHSANPRMGIGVAYFFAHRFDEAKLTLLQSLQEKPDWVPTYRFLASCYAKMGRIDEARETIARLRTITKVIIPPATHWCPEFREFFLSGLRLAAME